MPSAVLLFGLLGGTAAGSDDGKVKYPMTVTMDGFGNLESVTSGGWQISHNCNGAPGKASLLENGTLMTVARASSLCHADDVCQGFSMNLDPVSFGISDLSEGEISGIGSEQSAMAWFHDTVLPCTLTPGWTGFVDIGIKINPLLPLTIPKDMPTVTLRTYPQGVLLELLDNRFKICESFVNAPSINMWETFSKGFCYFTMLCYMFLGVGIVADKFMEAIEEITSQQKTISIPDPETGEITEIQINIWNDTVANLTLMALGSSAPEILLACIETVQGLGEPAGELGPSTIVGSASFNLFGIIGYCMICVPLKDEAKNETGVRQISNLKVFGITAFASVFAYCWMYIVLVVSSEDRIDMWEAVVTLIFFPLLVIVAWAQDNNWWRTEEHQPHGLTKIIARSSKSELTDHTVQKSAMYWRVQGTKQLTGKPLAFSEVLGDESGAKMALKELENPGGNDDIPKLRIPRHATLIEFGSVRIGTMENCGKCHVYVKRSGNLQLTHTVSYHTSSGTATEGKDFVHAEGSLIFKSGQDTAAIEIEILEDELVEEDEQFFVSLSNPAGESVGLGEINICTVTIIDVSFPGSFGFAPQKFDKRALSMISTKAGTPREQALLLLSFSEAQGKVKVPIYRVGGSTDRVSVSWETHDATAMKGVHYEVPDDNTVVFENGEVLKMIDLQLINNKEPNTEKEFHFTLVNPTNKAQLCPETKVIKIVITEDRKYAEKYQEVMDIIEAQNKKLEIGSGSWLEQIKDAMFIGQDEDDLGPWFYVLHALSFPWKVLFAGIPPTKIGGGWPAFWVALCFTGIVTMFIGEYASMLGCMIGLDDASVAVTIVALGTSLPDTFASKYAVEFSPDADAAVGNVTGSNAVNVFLGMGVPWLIASIYHSMEETPYITPAGKIGLSVSVFVPLASLAISFILARRKFVGAELGGPNVNLSRASFVFLLSLWFLFLYIVLTN